MLHAGSLIAGVTTAVSSSASDNELKNALQSEL